jgi:predicted nucleotidyltransferase
MLSFEYKISSKIQAEQLSQLTSSEQAGLTALVEELLSNYPDDLLQVVLFGSKARGDFHDQSDLDILVVIHVSNDEYWPHWNKIVNIASRIELTHNLVFSLIIKNEADFKTMQDQKSLFARIIQQDGIELFSSIYLPSTPNSPNSAKSPPPTTDNRCPVSKS